MSTTRTRATTLIGTVALAAGAFAGMPVIAHADTAPSTVSITSPTAGSVVGGTKQAITVAAPLGVQPSMVQCSKTVTFAPFAPTTWGPQAADGTYTGTVDLTACTNGDNAIQVYYYGTSTSGNTDQVAVTVHNPGVLQDYHLLSASSFTPNGDRIADTSTILGGYLQADKISVDVLDSRGRVVRHLDAMTWSETFGKRFYEATWDGRDDRGHLVKPGTYTYRVVATTQYGASGAQTYTVQVARAKKVPHATQTRVRTSASPAVTFFADPGLSGSSISVLAMLQNPGGTSTATITDTQGRVITTFPVLEAMGPEVRFTWDGTTSTGARAAAGNYVLTLTTPSGAIAKLPVTLTA